MAVSAMRQRQPGSTSTRAATPSGDRDHGLHGDGGLLENAQAMADVTGVTFVIVPTALVTVRIIRSKRLIYSRRSSARRRHKRCFRTRLCSA